MPLEPLPMCQTRIHALDPTRADIRVHFDSLPPDVEIRGRLMGPRCPGVTTVEVAYPFRRCPEEGAGGFQVIIPEPNLWTAEHPFRYEGPVEFWRQGQRVGQTTLSIGLRLEKNAPSLQATP